MVLRVSGLASGMDIDEIVKKMMTANRVPLDKLYQKKTYTEWQRDDYRTINTALKELDTLIFDGIYRQSSYLKKSVTISNPNAISVKNSSSTTDFSGTIQVSKLAAAATMTSTASSSAVSSKQPLFEVYRTLNPSNPEMGAQDTQTIRIKAINKDGAFDKVAVKDANGHNIIETLDNHRVYVDPSTGSPVADDNGEFFLADENGEKLLDEFGSPVTVSTSEFKTRMEDKWVEIEIKGTDTIQNVIDKINSQSGVTVFFDEQSKLFSVTAKNSGNSTGGPEIELDGSFFTNIMKVNTANKEKVNDVWTATTGSTMGENAKLNYNGLEIERSSNTFQINGVEITLKEANTGPVTFSSTADVDAIYDTIKKFVDSYNTLIETIKGKTGEKKNRSYAPLTDEQKEAMSESQIEKWEKFARQGTLYRDSTLNSLLTKMRTSIYTQVQGSTIGTLDKIGISTTKDYLAGGKLEINEEKLRKAIAEDPNAIYEMFMSDGETTGEKGIARRVRADLQNAMKEIGDKAGSATSVGNTGYSLGKLLDDYEDRITAFERKLVDMENRLYRQFTAMETAINKANSQSANLMQFFQ